MTTATQQSTRFTVLIEIADLDSDTASVVVKAAAQLFGPHDPVDVVLTVRGVEEPDEAHGRRVQEWCLSAVEAHDLPEILLLGTSEASATTAVTSVVADADPGSAARSVALLTALAQSLWDDGSPTPARTSEAIVPEVALPALQAALHRSDAEIAMLRRDVARGGDRVRRPVVAALFQHPGYWPSVFSLYQELRARKDVEFHLVALESPVAPDGPGTGEFLDREGFAHRPPHWLLKNIDSIDAVVLDNPYDELRPPQLRATQLASRGLRLVNIPYGNGAIAGDSMNTMLWDLPLQRLAWRSYLATPTQRRLYAAHCLTGDGPVRVLGTPKQDRSLDLPVDAQTRRILVAAAGRTVALWNPHFRVGQGGWSTFDRYVTAMLERFEARTDQFLVVRPHFRLLPALHDAGGRARELEEWFRRRTSAAENVLLDESPDYSGAFAAADALVSDLSSLASEFILTGKPLLYLHKADGPGPNAEGAYFAALPRAESWVDVSRFLDRLEDPDTEVEQRLELARRTFPFADGRASQRIADDIQASLAGELHLTSAPPLGGQGAEVVVEHLALERGVLGVRFTTDPPMNVELLLSAARSGSRAVEVSSGTREVALPLRQGPGPFDGATLPLGTYALTARVRHAGGHVDVPVDVARVRSLPPARIAPWGGEKHRIVRDGDDTLVLQVSSTVVEPVTVAAATYLQARRAPVEDAVLLTSFGGSAAACNPRALADELHRRNHPAPRYFVVRDASVPVPEGSMPVLLGSHEHHRLTATARWVVDNEAMPAHLRKRDGQVFVQTWHGTPLKLLRRDLHVLAPRDPRTLAECERDAGQWDVTISPNAFTTDVLRRGFGVTGQIAESGYPRNDVLADLGKREVAAQRVRAAYGIPAHHRVLLYAPTWRDESLTTYQGLGKDPEFTSYREQPTLDWSLLQTTMGGDVTFLSRGHRFVTRVSGADTHPAVVDASLYPDMADLLAAADVLVTDYSSSFFDFATTGRPMVFFAYDLEQYRGAVRGHYFPMEDVVPGPVLRRSEEVAEALADLPSLAAEYAGRYRSFREEFVALEDGGASARAVDAIFG